MESKRCSKCGVVKPLEDYNRRKSAKDGCQSHCRECQRAWQITNRGRVRETNRAWYLANKERRREYGRAWRQANADHVHAYREANKGHRHEITRAWREQNADRVRETERAWRERNRDKHAAYEHRRRARKSSAVPQRWTVDHTLGDPLACWWCGRGLLGAAVHTDHVMPIRLGGPAETANEVMSCADCNHSKNAKHPLVWIAELVS